MNNVVRIVPGLAEAGQRAFDPLGMLDLSPTAISYWGPDLECRYANRACRDWLRVDPEILVGCSLGSVLDALELDSHLEFVEAALRGEQRSVVQSFHEGFAKRDGLVQYVPNVRGHLVDGLLIQISPTPSTLRFTRMPRGIAR
jgi:PAS domain-containing protein